MPEDSVVDQLPEGIEAILARASLKPSHENDNKVGVD